MPRRPEQSLLLSLLSVVDVYWRDFSSFAENTSIKRLPCLNLVSLKRSSLLCELEDIKAVFVSLTSFLCFFQGYTCIRSSIAE